MQRMQNAEFLAWLAEAGITSRAGGSVWLEFAGESRRTWPAPEGEDALARWLAAVVDAASPGGPWWLWRRGGVAWGAEHQVVARAATAAGVGAEETGALQFAAEERGSMMGIIRAFATWPWGAHADLYLVPYDRSCVVMLCHDEEIHVHAKDRARLDAFAGILSAGRE